MPCVAKTLHSSWELPESPSGNFRGSYASGAVDLLVTPTATNQRRYGEENAYFFVVLAQLYVFYVGFRRKIFDHNIGMPAWLD